MTEVITIGLDLAKNVFQVHGVDGVGEVIVRRRLKRRQVLPFFSKLPGCLVGMEACAGAHHWARQLAALGHEVKLMPPRYVKAYVKRNKTDASDAEACCEAVTRPSMRFVAVKSPEQQSVLMLHRSRELLVRQRTMLVNAMRAHLAEFGVVAATGLVGLKSLLAVIADASNACIPAVARSCLQGLAAQLRSLHEEIATLEQAIQRQHRASEQSRRLATIPGLAALGASALSVTVSDPAVFSSGRGMAAWIGLVPREHSSGGKRRQGSISKQGDPYLRRLLVAGAMSVIRQAKRRGTDDPWLASLIASKPTKVAAVALANKNARIAWALMVRGSDFRRPGAAVA